MNFIGRMFPSESPVNLLIQHSKFSREAVLTLVEAFGAYFRKKDLDDFLSKVSGLEKSSDEAKGKLRLIYTKMRYVYFDRVDAVEILSNQELIIKAVDDLIKTMSMNYVDDCPEEIEKDIIRLSEEVRESVGNMVYAINKLSDVVKSAFSPSDVKFEQIAREFVEIYEKKTDTSGIEIGKKLYGLKREMNPVDIVFLDSLIVKTTKIADYAQNIVERLYMIVKE